MLNLATNLSKEDNVEKLWKVEWRKYSTTKVKTFTDGGAAKRWFMKFGTARLTEYERGPNGQSKVLSVSTAGNF